MTNRLGTFLRQKRGDASLRDFAKQCNISHTHLDSIEKGYDPRTGKSVKPSLEVLKSIAAGIGEELEYLIILETEDTQPESYQKPATKRVEKELLNFLNQSDIMFDGVPLTEDDKEKVRKALELAFWDAKNQNKRK